VNALEELEVWRRSKFLAVRIYVLLADCKDHGFKDQICRAAVSVPSNIAEGYERASKKDFANFLRIAKGSCAEVRTQIDIGSEIGYVPYDSAAELLDEYLQISMMLQGLINHCKGSLRV
jgi:four helix bundle protein